MSRYRRSSLGYSGGGGGGGGGLPSSSAANYHHHLSSASPSLGGGGGGGYTSTYTTAASSYLKNTYAPGGGSSGIGGIGGVGGVGGSSYSSPSRRPQRYGGAATDSNIDSLLASVGIGPTSSASASASATSTAAAVVTTPSRAIRSYRGARSHAELTSTNGLDDIGSAKNGGGTNSSSNNNNNGPSSSSVSVPFGKDWRSKSASTYGNGGGGGGRGDYSSRFGRDRGDASGYRSGGELSYQREHSVARSELHYPTATIASTSYPSREAASSASSAFGGRERHYSSRSVAAADVDMDRDFQQYVVGPLGSSGAGGSVGGGGGGPGTSFARDVSMARDLEAAYAASTSRSTNYYPPSRSMSRSMIDGTRESNILNGGGAGTGGVLSEGIQTRSPILSTAAAAAPLPPPRSTSRARRGPEEDLDSPYGPSPSRHHHLRGANDPFESRAKTVDPYDDRGGFHHSSRVGPQSPLRRSNSGGRSMLARSSSFRDLRDLEDDRRHHEQHQQQQHPSAPPQRGHKVRHQTLAYGVSPADLTMARSRNSSGGSGLGGGVGGKKFGGSRDFSVEWRGANQVPIVGGNVPGAVNFRSSTSDLQGFASDMSVIGGAGTVSNGGGNGNSSGSFSDSGLGGARPRVVDRGGGGGSRRRRRDQDRVRVRGAGGKAAGSADPADCDPGYSSQPGSRRASVGVRRFVWFFLVFSYKFLSLTSSEIFVIIFGFSCVTNNSFLLNFCRLGSVPELHSS